MIPKFPELEQAILADWKKNNVFQKTLTQTAKGKRFVFFEGPPTANGLPHIGHVLARIFKDVVCRYKTMRGFFVERKAGWDTQGLPVELEVEKQIGVSGKRDIEDYGIEKFNNECRKSVWKYKAEWEKMTERIGYWLDLEHPYITYEKPYIESLWWIFKQLWERKLLIKDYKVVPHCPRCETALSSHEVAQGYQKVTENSVYVKFKIKKAKGKIKEGDYILSWTTTPWTLPGNVALAVNANERYGITNPNENGDRFIIVHSRPDRLVGGEAVLKQEKDGASLGFQADVIGADLVGVEYEPLFPGAIPKDTKGYENAFKVYAADFVTTDEGTGVVHTAVMYGEDDYQLGSKVGLPKHHTVTTDGHFTKDVKEFAGQYVKDEKTSRAIVDSLRERNLLYKEEPYEHDYPFCWRCHSPLLYYAKDSWFIAMSKLREQLLKNNEQIAWVPEYIKYGRFGEWLNEIKDWAISRERYWGTPIPIWECDRCGKRECLGSYQELADKTGDKNVVSDSFDPHRPFVDALNWRCDCDGRMRRIPEVADTWFDSGSMPFAQWHYPFENKERIEKGLSFPGEYIAEAIDQTRGWFYTLLAVFTALGYDQPPYKNVICLGHVLDAKGVKMSKHIGNVVDPWAAINEFGIDPIRWYLYTVNQPGDYKRFDPEGIREVVKKNFIILWNVVSFFTMYRMGGGPPIKPPGSQHIIDRWLLARFDELNSTVTAELDHYHIIESTRALSGFINDLSIWYIRRSRDRFKTGDRKNSAAMLGYILRQLSILLAPFIPFYAEAVYREIHGEKESVHLEPWPKTAGQSDESLLKNMSLIRHLAEIAHRVRSEQGIKVRQPLAELVVKSQLSPELCEVLKDEVNVLEVSCRTSLPEEPGWIKTGDGETALALNTQLTLKLQRQGLAREIVRQVNALRKSLGLTRGDTVTIGIDSQEIVNQLAGLINQIKRDTIAEEIEFGPLNDKDWSASCDFQHDQWSARIGIKKTS
ncbi:MAG: isoleucine--tRNA ligase [Patescibacteria group bacterium]